MTQVLIMGDSWGVPEYTRTLHSNSPNPIVPHYTEPYHIEFFLHNLGYDVHNASNGGISNIQAIRNAIAMIANKSLKPDYVIWFHTALFRDYKHFTSKVSLILKYEEVVDQLAKYVYDEMKLFLERNNNPKLIAIGGQAPLVRHVFDEYFNPFFRIDDWRSEILNEKLPEFQAYGSEKMLPNWNWNSDVQSKLISTSDLYTKKMLGKIDDDPLFPDGCHPGRKPHSDLTTKIHNAIVWHQDTGQNHGYIKTYRDTL